MNNAFLLCDWTARALFAFVVLSLAACDAVHSDANAPRIAFDPDRVLFHAIPVVLTGVRLSQHGESFSATTDVDVRPTHPIVLEPSGAFGSRGRVLVDVCLRPRRSEFGRATLSIFSDAYPDEPIGWMGILGFVEEI